VLRLLAECYLRLAAAEPEAVRKTFLYVQSLDFAQQLSSVTPDDLEAVHLVGRAASGREAGPGRERLPSRPIRQPPPLLRPGNLGRTFMAGGRLEEAKAYLRTASVCAPRLAAVWESLGELYLELGQAQEAAAAFRRVEEIEPSHAAPQFPTTIPVFQPR